MDETRLSEIPFDALEPGCDYQRVALCDVALPHGFEGVLLEDSLLVHVRGAGIAMVNLQLRSCVVRDCDFANGNWEKARLAASQWSKCRLTGWNVAEGNLRGVRFVGCKIDLAVFHQASLFDCQFHHCDLREADFQGARLQNVTFRRCDLRAARFPAVTMAETDFRGSHLAGMYAEAASLRGSTFDPLQLADLARAFGITVADLDDDVVPRQ